LAEVSIFIVVGKIPVHISFSPNIFLGLVLIVISSITYFWLGKIAHYVTFWTPENTWGMMFLVLVLVELFSGMLFPLQILPKFIFDIVSWLPFPYMVYFPTQIILGQIPSTEVTKLLIQASLVLFICWQTSMFMWRKGLRQYSADGR
jgi:ABC-2 type transport system permease protein